MNVKYRKLLTSFKCGLDVLRYTFLKKRTPTVVIFSLTDICSGRCDYCKIWPRALRGFPKERVFNMLGQMKRAGTKMVVFTGGDPLERDDLGDILIFAKKLGFATAVLPHVVGKNMGSLEACDTLYVPLLGPPELTYRYWNQTEYNATIENIKEAQDKGIEVIGHIIFDRFNGPYVHYIVELTAALDIPITIDFFDQNEMITDTKGEKYHLSREQIVEILEILEALSNEYPHIDCSKRVFRYLIEKYRGDGDADEFRPACIAPALFAWIDTDGTLYPCYGLRGQMTPENAFKVGFDKAFRAVEPDLVCKQCTAVGTLELSFLAALDIQTGLEMVKRVIGL